MDELGVLVSHASCAFPWVPGRAGRCGASAGHQYACECRIEAANPTLRAADIPLCGKRSRAPEGAPTVLLYGHYDVQPAPMEQGWTSDPFVPEWRDGRLYGRGAADDKSGVAIHAGTLRVFDGRPPVGVKVIIEGEEETLSKLEAYVEKHPDRFKADVMIIADMGNITCGDPVLRRCCAVMFSASWKCRPSTTTPFRCLWRAGVGCFRRAHPSAEFPVGRAGRHGRPWPSQFDWPGAEYPEPLYRQMAGMPDGVEIVGDGTVGSKLWSKPNATVIGIDGPPSIADAGNVLMQKRPPGGATYCSACRPRS